MLCLRLIFKPFAKRGSIVHPSCRPRPLLWVRRADWPARAGAASAPASPFICALGRWTPHLISNQGDFSIFLLSTVRLQIWDFFITSFFFFNYTWAPFLCLTFPPFSLPPALLLFYLFDQNFFIRSVFNRSCSVLTTPTSPSLWCVCRRRCRRRRRCSPRRYTSPKLFVHLLDLLSFFVEEASMGAQFSKTAAKGEAAAERPGEVAVASSPSKANGQENGHVKVNGDASPAAAEPGAKEELQANGSAPAADKEEPAAPSSGAAEREEPVAAAAAAEAGPAEGDAAAEGEAAEPGSPAAAEGEAASAASSTSSPKAEDGATPSPSNETPKKKKKRFSFKKSFKLSGFSFKKNKKEAGEGGDAEGAAGVAAEGGKDEAAAEAGAAPGEQAAALGEEAAEGAAGGDPQGSEPEEAAAAPEKQPAGEEARATEEPGKAEGEVGEAGPAACEAPSTAGPGAPPEQEAAPAEEASASSACAAPSQEAQPECSPEAPPVEAAE